MHCCQHHHALWQTQVLQTYMGSLSWLKLMWKHLKECPPCKGCHMGILLQDYSNTDIFDHYYTMQYSSYITFVLCRDLKTDQHSHRHQFIALFTSIFNSLDFLYHYYSTVYVCILHAHYNLVCLVQQRSTVLLCFVHMLT